MTLNRAMDLPWEIDKAGGTGRSHDVGAFRTPRYGIVIKYLAVLKMMDVQVLTATFSDDEFTFEPWIVVAVDRGASIDFLGAYQRGFMIGEGEPEICLRTAHWSEEVDREGYNSADDKSEHVLSDRQVLVETSFGYFAECPGLMALAEEFETTALSGYALRGCDRDSKQRSNLYLKLAGRLVPFSCDLTYFLGAFQCDELEDLADRWVACAETMSFGSTFIPTQGTEISYTGGLAGRLADWSGRCSSQGGGAR